MTDPFSDLIPENPASTVALPGTPAPDDPFSDLVPVGAAPVEETPPQKLTIRDRIMSIPSSIRKSSSDKQDTGQGRLSSAGGSFLQSGGRMISSIPKYIGISESQASYIHNKTFDEIDRGEFDESKGYHSGDIYEYYHGSQEKRQQIRSRWKIAEDPRNHPAYIAGQKFDEWLSENIKTNPKFRDEFFAGRLPAGAGSAFGFLVAAAVTRSPGAPAYLGAMSQGSEGFEDALAHNANIEEAFKSSNFNAVIGTSEAIPIVHILDRVDKSTGGAIKRTMINMIKSGTEEGVQESLQQIASNLVASDIVKYDPDRGMWVGSGEGGEVGFTTGALMQLIASATGIRLRGRQFQQVTEQQTEPHAQDEKQPDLGEFEDLVPNLGEFEDLVPKSQETAPDRRQEPRPEEPDRRQNMPERKRVGDMTPEEMKSELLTSTKTDLPNERAYNENQNVRKKHQSFMDLDNFKELNTQYTYEGADQILEAVGKMLKEEAQAAGAEVIPYHLHGDEYIVESDDLDALNAYSASIQERAKNGIIEVTLPDGQVLTKQGLGVSYGIGTTKQTAESSLKANKQERAKSGLRTERERVDSGVAEQATKGKPDNKSRNTTKVKTKKKARTGKDEAAIGDVGAMAGTNYIGFIENAKRIPEKRQSGKRATPIRREPILIKFLKAMDVPLYKGRVKGGKLGYYRPWAEMVRVKRAADLETTAHEMAHMFDDRVFNGFKSLKNPKQSSNRPWVKGGKAKIYAKELGSITYDKNKVYEGFAEFVRLWMTQPKEAKAAAPEFYQYFEKLLDGNRYGPAMREAKAGMMEWYGQEPAARAESKIGETDPLNGVLDTTSDEFRQSVADQFHGILKMERDLLNVTEPVALGAYETIRLSVAGYSIASGAIENGAPVVQEDGSIKFEGKGLKEILDQIGVEIDEWTLWAVGKSAAELKGQGRENLFTREEIDGMLELEKPGYEKVFNDYLEWNKRIVDFAVAKGLIDPLARARWRRSWYLPFYRVGQMRGGKRKKGIEGNWDGIKTLTGGTENLRDIIDNMVQNASMLITQALKNEARVKIADLSESARGGARYMVKISKVNEKIGIDSEQVRDKFLEALGIDPKAYKQKQKGNQGTPIIDKMLGVMQENMSDWTDFWQRGNAPKGNNVIAVLRGGKPEYYEVIDPLVYRSISAMNPIQKHVIRRFLGILRRFGQTTITLTLDFASANMWRDTWHGWVFSKHGFKPVVDSFRGLKYRIQHDQVYKDYIANGGGMSSIYMADGALRNHIQYKLRSFYTKKGINWKNVIYLPADMLYFMETIADATEMSTRLGEFQKDLNAGEHPRHAAYLAREISVDFNMRGDEATHLGQTVAWGYDSIMFLKAAVVSMDRVYRGFAKDQNRSQIMQKTAAIATVSVMLYLMNRDNPCYEQLEDWDRDTHWHLYIPKGKVTQGACRPTEWHHFRFPKIWEIGAVGTTAERSMELFLDGVQKDHKADGKKYVNAVSKVFFDLFKVEYIPYAIEPLVETYGLNYERFTGRAIETEAEKQRLPFTRYSPYTNRMFVNLSEQTKDWPTWAQEMVTPKKLESLYRGYFNTFGLYGLMLTDETLFKRQTPSMPFDRYPVIRRFYVSSPRRTREEKEFWTMLDEARQLHNTVNFMVGQERDDLATHFDNKPDTHYYEVLQDTAKTLQDIRKEMEVIYLSGAYSRNEKRQKLDALSQERNNLIQETVWAVKKDKGE